jgi:tetratricopeptide (TPR) repeat protein
MITLLFAATLALVHQKMDVSVDVKPNEVVSGVRHFRLNVTSPDPVTQVEFYVGSELRDSDSSIPYEFNLDTIDEKDGNLQLTFAAYTSKGDSQKQVINIDVDNGVAQGADAHVQKGIDFIHDSKWDEAILQARIAIKIDPASNPARMVMARAYLGKGTLDKAQKYAEDWHQAEPASTDASELLAGIDLHRALTTMSRGTDKEAALASIQAAFKRAIDTRKDVLQTKMDQIGTPTADNLIAFADAAMSARRYNMAINALSEEYHRRVDRTEVTNRLAYAQMMSGKLEDSYTTLMQVKRLSKLDAYGNALMAVILAISHDDRSSDKFMQEALSMDSTDVGVRTAQAFIALRAHKMRDLQAICATMINDNGDRPEVNYYADALAGMQGNFGDARHYFETMVYADPLSEAGYIEEGNNALLFAVKGTASEKQFRANSARAMFETALEVRPESYRGLLGLSLVSLLVGEKADGLKFAVAAVKTAPTQPSALFVQSAALSLNGQATEAYNADRLAWKYDQTLLSGRAVPKAVEAWKYYSQYDRMPVMTPPR